jgi:hypothetical protein
MTTNPVIDGGSVNGRIRNFSTISALNLLVSNISTGTTSVDQIYTRNINIDPPSTVYISHPDLTINANLTTDENEDPQPNNLNLYASSNVNIQCGNNPSAFSVNITGDTYVSRTFTASLGISTTNINLSTINGAAYTPGGGGGGGWVSTATTALNMAGFDINNVSSIKAPTGRTLRLQNNGAGAFIEMEDDGSIYAIANGGSTNQGMDSGLIFNSGVNITNKVFGATSAHTFEVYDGSAVLQNSVIIDSNGLNVASKGINMGDTPIKIRNDGSTGLAWGSVAPYSVGIDGPYLFGYSQGALGTTISTLDISLAWDAAEVNIYKTLDMEDNFILNVSTITASGELSISANNDILTSSVSTINTVQNTYFSGGVSRRLAGVGVEQPVIQYGEFTSSGSSGNTTVSLPAAYTATNTFVAFACMEDSNPAEMSVVRTNTSTIEVYWQGGGGGSHTIVWQALGT